MVSNGVELESLPIATFITLLLHSVQLIFFPFSYIGYFNSKFNSCIKIRPKNSRDKNWVDVVPQRGGGGCGSSYVGRQTKMFRQKLELNSDCFTRKTIVHEFIHALGFTHEQNRPDRDKYVTINYGNIMAGQSPNFDKGALYSETYGVPYEPKSVMHYPSTAFSKNR